MTTNGFTAASGQNLTDDAIKTYWRNIGDNFGQLYDDAYSKKWTRDDLYNFGQYSQGIGIGQGASKDAINSLAGQYGYSFDGQGLLTKGRQQTSLTPQTFTQAGDVAQDFTSRPAWDKMNSIAANVTPEWANTTGGKQYLDQLQFATQVSATPQRDPYRNETAIRNLTKPTEGLLMAANPGMSATDAGSLLAQVRNANINWEWVAQQGFSKDAILAAQRHALGGYTINEPSTTGLTGNNNATGISRQYGSVTDAAGNILGTFLQGAQPSSKSSIDYLRSKYGIGSEAVENYDMTGYTPWERDMAKEAQLAEQRRLEDRGNPNGPWSLQQATYALSQAQPFQMKNRDYFVNYAKSLLARGISPENVAKVLAPYNKYDLSADVPELGQVGYFGTASQDRSGGAVAPSTYPQGAQQVINRTNTEGLLSAGGVSPVGGNPNGGTASGAASGSLTQTGSINAPGMDYNTETIEGRIGNLLDRDASGNFTNPVIRQAADRALATFAGRGLLNSSMSQEAVMEAAIAKAIEIAGPDAERYFQNRRQNYDWTQKFGMNEQEHGFAKDLAGVQNQYAKELLGLENTYSQQNLDMQQARSLQQNYLQAVANFESQYNQSVMAINASEMNADDKTAAIENITILRDNNIRLTTEAFAVMPQWQSEWSKLTTRLPSSTSPTAPPKQITENPASWSNAELADMIDYYDQPANRGGVPQETFAAWEAEAQRRLAA